MRTRFLNADYFSSSSSSTETLSFLNLPVPHLPPSALSNISENLFRFDSPLHISLHIESFPIDTALSKFFSDVIPHSIDVDSGDLEATMSRRADCCSDEQGKTFSPGNLGQRVSDVKCDFLRKDIVVCSDERKVESRRTFGSEIQEIGLHEKDNLTSVDDEEWQRFEIIQFEAPELDASLEEITCFYDKEIGTYFEIPEIEYNLGDFRKGLKLQYPSEIQESVYLVEDVTLDYNMEQKTYTVEDDDPTGDQMHLQRISFPLLEVCEISLRTLPRQPDEEVLLSVFEYIDFHSWTQKNNLLNDSKELLGSVEHDIFKLLSDCCLLKQFPEPEEAFPDIFLELNLMSLVEALHIEENSGFSQEIFNGDCFSSTDPLVFEEFQLFDVDSSPALEVFFNRQTTIDQEPCRWIFTEEMNLKSCDELIVSHELTLEDDTFKSFPVPVLSDQNRMSSLYTIVGELLPEIKPLPLSASDGIYLDWDILEKDKCTNKIYFSFQNMVEEIDLYSIGFDWESSEDQKLVSDFIFGVDGLSDSTTEGYEESANISFDGVSVLNVDPTVVASGDLQDGQCTKPGNREQVVEKDVKKASLLLKSMSQFNDLDFFLNPQKASAGESAKFAVQAFDLDAKLPKAPSSDSVAGRPFTSAQLQQWDIVVHDIKLSDDIVNLIGYFEASYLAILKNETELNSFLTADDHKLLSLPKEKLMECIKKKMSRRTTYHGDEDIWVFVTLSAVKQMAWYLCFYGIQTTYLYVDNLCQGLSCLKSRLGSLHSLMEDAYAKLEKETTRLHPSLSVIQGILQLGNSQSDLKILILAERLFWCPLKSLLTSMGLKCNELPNFCVNANQSDSCNTSEFTNANIDSGLISDCLLVAYEHVSVSFPFNKFSLILEYGGSRGSSRISSFSTKLTGLPRLHFLKMELNDFSASKALCEGVNMPQNIKMATTGESHSIIDLDDHMNGQKLEELLNFVPVQGKYTERALGAADKMEAKYVPISCLPFAVETKGIQQRTVETVIIVNTQNVDKEMIVSRRSTYQKILAMEKEGAQVVERDSDLPVDIIISSAICLVWYNCRNIGNKAATLDEASSCLALCVETIATNVLTLLSFTFSGCFLVFEGEISFLSTVMESSSGLYAAAASLGIDFQLFCSYSSELTDEIILNCIQHAAKLTRGQYPRMPESETLAESFLTKFPSINPLTAHAILSSGGLLNDFLEWSHEQRVRTIQKYCVPDESLALFSTLCKFSEREDSKSIMTDCSSSISSGPDSEKSRLYVGSERKRRRRNNSPHKININVDDLLHFDSSNKCTDDVLDLSGPSNPYNPWVSRDLGIFEDYKKPSSFFNDMLGQKQELDLAEMKNSSRTSMQYDCQISKGSQSINEIIQPNIPLTEECYGHTQGQDMAFMSSLDCHNVNHHENRHGHVVGEVIDLTDSLLSGDDFPSIANSMQFSHLVPEMENSSERKSKIARRFSFGKSNYPSLSSVSGINSRSDILSSVKYTRSFQGTNDRPDAIYNGDKLSLNHQVNLLEVLGQRTAGGTPLTKAITSTHTEPGSPWTVEFLNRIREKSRLRQQHLSVTPSSHFRSSGNTSKAPKRSPSILDFFKYQGGNTPRKIPEEKKQKRHLQSSSSSKVAKSSPASFLPTSTPIDKRAKQTLSFATDASGNQTKLVWSDGSAHVWSS